MPKSQDKPAIANTSKPSIQRAVQVILGGTFDPIHFGHLRVAQELVNRLPNATVSLMPAAIPPHKQGTGASAEQRLEMLELALQGIDSMAIDSRELVRQRKGLEQPSYSRVTLEHIRHEHVNDSVIFVMGTDSFAHLDRWYQWRELLDYCHILVVGRPRSSLPNAGVVADYYAAHKADRLEQLTASTHGLIGYLELPELDISSTQIRAQIFSGNSPRFLLPSAIMDYIEHHGLYRK